MRLKLSSAPLNNNIIFLKSKYIAVSKEKYTKTSENQDLNDFFLESLSLVP